MKKLKILLLFPIFVLFGCNKIENNNLDYKKYVDDIIVSKNKFVNKSSNGYKYYIPKGMILKKENNNNIILSYNNTNIYFFVDIISYYYNEKNNNEINHNNFDYFKELKDSGFIIVDENNEEYFVKLSYNFSTIEFYTKKDNIPSLLTVSSIILNSVEFNKNIIKTEIDNGYKNNNDKTYEIVELNKSNSSFSQYLNSYEEEKNVEDELPD